MHCHPWVYLQQLVNFFLNSPQQVVEEAGLGTKDSVISPKLKEFKLSEKNSVETVSFLLQSKILPPSNDEAFLLLMHNFDGQKLERVIQEKKFPKNTPSRLRNYINLLKTGLDDGFLDPWDENASSEHGIVYLWKKWSLKLSQIEEMFNTYFNDWKTLQEEEAEKQQQLLKELYRRPLLPDSYSKEFVYTNCTSNFDGLIIPETKGVELQTMLETDLKIGRGSEEFTVIPIVDLSSFGKTFTVFNLAKSIPKVEKYKHFFVCYLDCAAEGPLLTALRTMKELSNENLVWLMCFASFFFIWNLLSKVQKPISGVEFLKFFRDIGESLIDGCLDKPCMDLFISDTNLQREIPTICKILNNVINTNFGVKVVFAFDEAQALFEIRQDEIQLSDGKNGCLFHACYKVISKFTNVLFLGTSLKFCKVEKAFAPTGREIISPLIGCMTAWFPVDVALALADKLDVTGIRKSKLDVVCYLLSGSPSHVTKFHSTLLNMMKDSSNKRREDAFMECVEKVVNQREQYACKKIDAFINDKERGLTPILKLLFGLEVASPSLTDQQSKENTLIMERGIANVVNVGSKHTYEISDPIDFKTYFKLIFTNYRSDMWNFLLNCCSTHQMSKGDLFEHFMTMLFLEESERLGDGSIDESSLFPNLKFGTDYTLKISTFLKDKTLTKANLSQSFHIPGIWYAQLFNRFLDTCVKLDNNMGPDLVFVLKHRTTPSLNVPTLCAFSLVSDPETDVIQSDKFSQMLKITDIEKIGSNKEGSSLVHLDLDVQQKLSNFKLDTMAYLRIIVCPNMPTSVKQKIEPLISKSKVIVIGKQEIGQCIAKLESKSYHDIIEKISSSLIN